MDWSIIITQTAVSGITLATVAYLLKALISQQLAKDMEAFKRQLAVEAERDRVRFSRLHERRAEVIEEVYKRLVHISGLLGLQNAESGDVSATAEHLDREVIEVIQYFGAHGLYFSRSVKGKFHRVFVEGLPKPLLMLHGIGELEKLESVIREKFGDVKGRALRQPFLKGLKEQLPLLRQLLQELEGEFQAILGVPEEPVT